MMQIKKMTIRMYGDLKRQTGHKKDKMSETNNRIQKGHNETNKKGHKTGKKHVQYKETLKDKKANQETRKYKETEQVRYEEDFRVQRF